MESPTRRIVKPEPEWKRIVFKSVTESGSIWAATFPAAKMCWEKRELIQPVGVDKIEFKVGDLYAVKGEYCDYWYRGRVTFLIDDKVEVFLVDIGEHRWVEKKNLLALSEYLKKITPQIFQVNFHGIQPLVSVVDEGLQFAKVPSHEWSRGAVDVMKKKLDASKAIYFKEVETVNVGKFDNNKTIKFGSIFIEYMDEIICLNDILCAEGFAIKVDSFCGIAVPLTKQLTKEKRMEIKKRKKKNGDEGELLVESSVSTLLEPAKSECHHILPSVNKSFSFIERFSEFLQKFVNTNSVSEDKQHPSTAEESTDESCRTPANATSSSHRHVSDSGSEVTYSDNEIGPKQHEQVDRRSSSGTISSHRHDSDSGSEVTYSDNEIESKQHERVDRKRKMNNMFSLFSILLHMSPDIEEPIEPVTSLIETYVCERIQRVLKERRRYDLTPLQKHVYPVLCKRHNIVVVGNTKSGKTLASVVAIVSLLRQEEFYSSLKKNYGPKAIHLCSYSYKVRNVTKMYKDLISGVDVVTKMACGGTGVDSVKIDLLGGCDILVTTPACLLRILNAAQITNLNRLCHIVYDDADIIFDVFKKEIKILTASIKALEASRTAYKVQKVVLSQIWFPRLERFVKDVIFSGFICVSNFNQLEAAIYSNLKLHFSFLQPQTKADYLFNLLQSHQSSERVVVICNSQDEVIDLEKSLESTGKHILIAHEGMTPIQVSYVKKAWIETITQLNPIMICTDSSDSILSELEITDCTWLIHYSLPFSKTVFSNRFGCLLDSYTNIFLDEEKPKPKINVFIDETNDEQFPEIVTVMKRLKIHVDPTIEKVVKRINKRKEKAKKHSPVCDQLREFGACYEQKVCNFRHIFIKSVDDDEAALVPKFISPNPSLGDMVAVQPENGVFCRGKVITILKRDEKKAPKKVRVKLVDVGKIMELNVLQLYDLPEHLKAYEGQAIDVFLCNIKPADHDCAWDLDAVAYVQRWIDKAQKAIRVKGANHYLYGKINMVAGYTLWLDRLTYCEWLEETKTEVHSSLGFELIQKNIVLPNPDHMKMIKELCAKAQLNIFINETKQEKCPKKEKLKQWAHLPRDEFSTVEVIQAKKPDLMLVRHVKFKDRLDLLTKDISEVKLSRLNGGELVVGDVCLAFFEDDETWNRAKVMELKSTTEVRVFYVDHGDYKTVSWKNLAKISDTFITRLPFQAIECRLTGVRAPNGNWCEDIDVALYQLTEFEELDCKPLQAYVFDLELEATVTGGRKYSIVLIDTNVDPFVVINKELVNSELAEWDLKEDTVFDDIVSQCKAISVSDDESEEHFLDEPDSHGFIDLNDNIENVKLESSKKVVESSDSHQTWSDVKWDGGKVVPVEEPEYVSGPFQRILDNFVEHEDDLFSLLGLNKNKLLQDLLPSLEYEKTDSLKITEIQNTSDVDGDVSEVEDNYSSKTKVKTKHKLKKRAEEDRKNDCDVNDRPPPLVPIGNCYNPKVTWFDDRQHVWVYVHLTNVQSYKVTWTYRSLSFRTISEEKYYSADFTLFGVIYPSRLEHSAKGFYVLIKMKKYVFGEPWPRLMITDGTYNWIKRHVDHIEGSDSSDNNDTTLEEKGKVTAKQAFNNLEFIMDPKPPGFYSDSEFSSDPYEPPVDGFDREDPLASLHR